MLKKILMVVAISSAAASAYAVDHTQVKQQDCELHHR